MLSHLLQRYFEGQPAERLKLLFAAGWGLAPVIGFLNRYVFTDVQFLVNVLVIIAVDTVLGVMLAIRRKKLSSEGFARLFTKLVVYLLLLAATHAVARHTVHGELNALLTWLDGVVYAAILTREFLSILEKTAALGVFRPPVWLISRLKQFDETGKYVDESSSPTPPNGNPEAPAGR